MKMKRHDPTTTGVRANYLSPKPDGQDQLFADNEIEGPNTQTSPSGRKVINPVLITKFKVLDRETTCKRCAYLVAHPVYGSKVHLCLFNDGPGVNGEHMTYYWACEMYEEKE